MAKLVESYTASITGELGPNLQAIGLPDFWEKAGKGKGRVAAILDTGIDYNHPDLQGQVLAGKSFVSYTTDHMDDNGHGSHVAGIIAAKQNGIGVCGVAPEAKLIIGKVADKDGYCHWNDLIEGIRWATAWRGPNGEKVDAINISIAGTMDNIGLDEAIKDAVAAGIMVCCAAGNTGGQDKEFPAYNQDVVEVVAANNDGNLAPFSSFNDQADLMAPGVGINSTIQHDCWGTKSGTSMATPHVTGAALLIRSLAETILGREITEAEWFQYLVSMTRDMGLQTFMQGHGMLCLDEKLLSVQPEWDKIDKRKVITAIHQKSPLVLDSPEFWLNELEKFENGTEFTKEDFQFVLWFMYKANLHGIKGDLER